MQTRQQNIQTNGIAYPVKEERRRFVLSRDPNKALTQIMETIERLSVSLEEETVALKDADTATFLTLQDAKLLVARDYLEGMSQLMERKDEIKEADESLKTKLEEMRAKFSELAQDNHAALERMKSGMKRLGERIMETAREAARKEEQIIYGATGHMQSGSKASIGINESA